jgi:antitoxin (DNA-binding transcriptional repressor) of toxin-antitoxin stability system
MVGNARSRQFDPAVAAIRNGSHLVVHRCGIEGVALVLRPRYGGVMTRTISQRELRNDSGAIMRALDRGEVFLVTRNGIPVGELRPARRRFVSRDLLLEAFANAPQIDAKRFRDELDDVLDQTVEPRA